MCGEIFFSLGYLRIAQRLAVVVIEVANLEQISDVPPGKYCFILKDLRKGILASTARQIFQIHLWK